MAPATRRKIWWVAGAFVVYEVIRLAVGLIAGSVAWANLSSLGNDGMNQTSQVAEGRLQTAGSAAGIAHAALQDPLYWALGALPHVGEDLKLANLATDATARSAGHLAEVFGNIPANQNLSELGLSSFAAKDVYHSLEALEKVAKDIAPQMGALNTTQLDFGMGPKVEKALPAIRAFAHSSDHLVQLAASAAVVGQSGRSKPAYWFLANQNLAEARGTGGLIGSYAVVKIERGQITLEAAGSDQELNALGPVDHSSLPVDTGMIWQDDPKIWQDLNPSAHTPYAAEQIAASWLKYKHQALNGVIFMGQGVAQDLVAAVGPVSFDGNTLDASNTAEFLAKGIYAKYQDVSAKNQAVQKFMVALMAAAKQNKPNLMGLLTEVYESSTGDHISIWSADSKQQAWNMSHRIAGSVSTAKNQDVTVAVNNGGGNKLEAYLHMNATYGLCMAKGQAHFSLKLGNTAPRVGLPAYVVGRFDLGPKDSYMVGSNLENVTVYLPIGAQISSLLVDGESYGAGSYVDRGHQILVFDIPINPGQHRVIDIDWQPARTAGAASQEPRVLMSPQFNRPGIRASASCD